ncbi:MAG: hypothetical protein HYX50_02230 [Chloroflexi bacterium]|nr:hypothetical protein [Chloroflexota bacterium]
MAFKQLARWSECGATGKYCYDVMVVGGDQSFDEATRINIEQYRRKGWTVNQSRDGYFMSDPGRETCIDILPFSPSHPRSSLVNQILQRWPAFSVSTPPRLK